jgi:hypothetical protein
MDCPVPFTTQEWQALKAVMPGGGTEAEVLLREKLFKELVVRAAASPENRFKPKSSSFRGTFKLSDISAPLRVILSREGVSSRCTDAVVQLHVPAFAAAQKWVNSISVIAPECIDMNQFHALVLYIGCSLSLSHCTPPSAFSGGGNDMVDVETLRGLLVAMCDPSKAVLGIPFFDISIFGTWRGNPEAAFTELADPDGCLLWESLVDKFAYHVVQALVTSDEFRVGCRKRAYQLLQALNNIPSLPNAVPGPMSARSDASSTQQSTTSPEFNQNFARQQKTSQWLTSSREGFPLFSPREPQAIYAVSHRSTQRDMGWRVFPVEMPKLQMKKSKFAITGGKIASE